jgi:hypothetical protein
MTPLTAALSAASGQPSPHLFYIAAAAVAVLVVIWAGHKLGDLIPYIAGGAIWAAVVWFGPLVPHSPLACTRPGGGHCAASLGTINLAELVLGLALIVLYKMIRGDKRGENGTRLP